MLELNLIKKLFELWLVSIIMWKNTLFDIFSFYLEYMRIFKI